MKLRTAHRFMGLLAAPLMIVTAIGGGLLLFRRTGLYESESEFRETIEKLHNYEVVAPYVGTVATVLMLAMAVTGLAMFVQVLARKRKARHEQAQPKGGQDHVSMR